MKIVFMGTPDFAAVTLESLIRAGHHVCLALTQADKPKGRGQTVIKTPVRQLAEKHSIECMTPIRLNKDIDAISALQESNADVFVVAAYGQILKKEILDIPPYGCLNVHASLLPKYRGASPINAAILNGDAVTGVTIMRMDEGLDTGDILYQKEQPIEEGDNAQSLFEKLAVLGGEAVNEALLLLKDHKITALPQDHTKSSHTQKIKKEDGKIDWSKSADELLRQIRAYEPWPGSFTTYKEKTLKICGAVKCDGNASLASGTVIQSDKSSFRVKAGDGAIIVTEVLLEGKKRMTAGEFLRGNQLSAGDRLGGA